MHVGLLGLPQAGKKTLLHLLTGVDARSASPGPGETVPGICAVRDPRVDRLSGLYRPKKTTPATIQYLLMPDLSKDSQKNQELLKALLAVDVLVLVVRAFEHDAVFHLDGSVDPRRDLDTLHTELLLNDLMFVEKRLERIQKDAHRRSGVDREKEQALLQRLQAHLNENRPLRTLPLEAQDATLLSGTPLLTRKAELTVLNIGEGDITQTALRDELAQRHQGQGVHVLQVSVKIEEELSQLDDPAEREAFLKELGITESAIAQLTRVSYEALGLISYFTVGEDEVRAWTVRRGSSAAEAGGVIHSDIERGFIRAELIKYGDLIGLGSEQAVSQAGKSQLKGKDYVVEDGDILNFRFNV